MKEKNQSSALEEDSVDIDLNDPDVENAATKIQAGFRGHKTRKEMQKNKGAEVIESDKTENEDIDIDLDDPEVAAAATKIQAGFKVPKQERK